MLLYGFFFGIHECGLISTSLDMNVYDLELICDGTEPSGEGFFMFTLLFSFYLTEKCKC